MSYFKEAKMRGKEQAKKSFLMLCLAAFVPALLSYVIITVGQGVGSLVVYLGCPLVSVGVALVYLNAAYGEPIEFSQIFIYYRQWWTAFCMVFLMNLFITLWSFLLWVPGIIAALRYSMSYYILAENPDISATEAIQISKEMTHGHLWDLFCLHLSFIGWYLVSFLTVGLALIWVVPYVNAAQANAFLMLKEEYLG